MKVFGITGHSGAGKTTLIERLIPALIARGVSVSLIKHTHHGFDIDRPGKDSFRMREAGAREVLLANDQRWALMHELRGAPEPQLEAQLRKMAPVDLVLVEGYKRAPMPKLEVWRAALGLPTRFQDDATICALGVDGAGPADCALPLLQLQDTAAIVAFILTHAASMNELA